MTLETQIPFAGFYCSVHDDILERELHFICDIDDSGDGDPSLMDAARDAVDWSGVYAEYARAYVEDMALEYGLELEFSDISSPRYYNFSTDRIFATISRDSLAKIWRGVPRDAMRAEVVSRFSHRDGFISHYPSDLDEWPARLSKWDHNQIGTLLDLYLSEQCQGYGRNGWDSMCELDLMESARGNGFLHNILFANDREGKLAKVADVARYLRQRRMRA